MMRNVIYLNKWGHLYHLMLVVTDGETEHRLHSRICLTLGEAHRLIEHWRQKHYIGPNDVQDNSQLDMNESLKGMETDFSPAQN
jgi:hypothetical protein